MNKKNFDMMMKKFSEVYERALTPNVISIYFDVCGEIPDNQVKTIITNCLKKCHYFPRPVDIFASYDEFALESNEMRKTTKEELEISIRGIRKARQDLEKVKEPEKIGNIIKKIEPDKLSKN